MRYKIYKDTLLDPCGTVRARDHQDARLRASMLWGGSPEKYWAEATKANPWTVVMVFLTLGVFGVGWYWVSGMAG